MEDAQEAPGGPYELGCGHKCVRTGVHTRVWGDCAQADPPPCEHPQQAPGGFTWDEDYNLVRCLTCKAFVGLMDLVEAAALKGVVLARGCTCWGDEEDGGSHRPECGSKAVGWALDPAQVASFVLAVPKFLRKTVMTKTLLYAGEDPDGI